MDVTGTSRGSPRILLAAIRRREAVLLRMKGMTYREIAAELGISANRAQHIIIETLDDTRAKTGEDIERLRELEGRRMDEVIRSLWDARADPEAASTIIRASARRAKLYGLDVPLRIMAPANEEAPPMHWENLSLDELREYERLLAKVCDDSSPTTIDVTPNTEAHALPAYEAAAVGPEENEDDPGSS